MNFVLQPWHIMILAVSPWANREQALAIKGKDCTTYCSYSEAEHELGLWLNSRSIEKCGIPHFRYHRQ